MINEVLATKLYGCYGLETFDNKLCVLAPNADLQARGVDTLGVANPFEQFVKRPLISSSILTGFMVDCVLSNRAVFEASNTAMIRGEVVRTDVRDALLHYKTHTGEMNLAFAEGTPPTDHTQLANANDEETMFDACLRNVKREDVDGLVESMRACLLMATVEKIAACGESMKLELRGILHEDDVTNNTLFGNIVDRIIRTVLFRHQWYLDNVSAVGTLIVQKKAEQHGGRRTSKCRKYALHGAGHASADDASAFISFSHLERRFAGTCDLPLVGGVRSTARYNDPRTGKTYRVLRTPSRVTVIDESRTFMNVFPAGTEFRPSFVTLDEALTRVRHGSSYYKIRRDGARRFIVVDGARMKVSFTRGCPRVSSHGPEL